MTNVLAISYAKRLLVPESRERKRAERYAQSLGHYVVIVFTHKDEGYEPVQQVGNMTLYATNSSSKLAMLARALKLGRLALQAMTEESFTVSSQDPFESALIARLLVAGTRHRHQIQIHGDVFSKVHQRRSLLQRIRFMYGKRVIRQADQIRVVSQRIKDSVVALGINESKIVVLPIWAELETFMQIARERFGDGLVPETATTLRLLWVGRIESEKNLSRLLRVCAALSRQQVAYVLRIVGEGSEKTAMQRLAIDLGIQDSVLFVGWQEDLRAEFANSEVYCLTSAHEGWAMVLQEAAAAGLAIVTTDVGCVGEVLYPDEHVLLARTTVEFTDAIISLADQKKRKQLALRAHQQVLSVTMNEDRYIAEWVATH